MLQTSPRSHKVVFGLGEIAWRRQDTNAAIGFYQQCLSLSQPATADHKIVAERLRQLKGIEAK